MSVLTNDIILEGIRRDDVLAWLADPAHHERLLQGAFDGLSAEGPGRYTVHVKAPPHAREMTYRFERVDEEHGGRRVHVTLGGKRTSGNLHYSLRTVKPAANTLVTVHVDLQGGGILGQVIEMAGLRKRLEEGFRAVLTNLQRELVHTQS